MKRLRKKKLRSGIVIALAVAIAASAVRATSQDSDQLIVQEIANEFKQVPCKNSERSQAVRELFERMGAGATDIATAKIGGVENIVVSRKAQSEETIIVGAHRDFVDLGCGAVDNWSGVVAMAYVYRAIAKLGHRKNMVFVAFDREERGLIGSKAMANAIKKESLTQYCAMVNLDSFGLAQPFALENVSSSALMTLSQQLSDSLQIPFTRLAISGADADSSSFLARRIPSITLSGLSNNWSSILHTTKDQKEIVNPISVLAGYRLVLSLLKRIDDSPCDKFR
jgi:Zn-dependent M28 family amino/carboxypeptidase